MPLRTIGGALACAAVLWVCGAVSARAESPAHDALNDFGNRLYSLGEQNGGTPKEWAAAEARVLAVWDALAAENRLDPAELSDKGTPLLTRAPQNGYAFAVNRLLAMRDAKAALDLPDEQGLTAYQHAQLAVRVTLRACHPKAENPFVLFPLFVKQGYYADRDPYPGIIAALTRAGADTDQSPARAFWLAQCPDALPSVRAAVSAADELYPALLDGLKLTARHACLEEVAQTEAAMTEIFGGEKMSVKRRKELDAVFKVKRARCRG